MKNTLILVLLVFISCNQKTPNPFAEENHAAALQADKKTIVFPEKSLGLEKIKVEAIGTKGQFVSVIAPSHVIASASKEKNGEVRLVLESPAVNELYYNFAQARETRKNHEKNYQRLKDMTAQQAATLKDLRDGERDLQNSKYAENEAENKIRAIGLFPGLIKEIQENTVLLVSDVPENLLSHVEEDEDVDVIFNSFPNDKFIGKVRRIGDVIDSLSRTLKITVSLPNPQGRFKAGMFAKVEFGDFTDNLLSVPIKALFTSQGKSFVFVAANERTFSLREVSVAVYGETAVGINGGLEPQEKIVTEGVLLLKSIQSGN